MGRFALSDVVKLDLCYEPFAAQEVTLDTITAGSGTGSQAAST